MCIFAKLSHLSHISRSFSYHDRCCRPPGMLQGSCTKCVALPPPATIIQVQFYSKRFSSVFTFNTEMNVLRKRISCNETSDSVSKVLPVGIVVPECKDGRNIKIVIVPLDIQNPDKDTLAKTLIALEELRIHAHEIDAFTNKMIDDCKQKAAISDALQQEQKQAATTSINEIGAQEVIAISNQIVTEDKEESAFVEMGSLPKADVTPNAPNPGTTPNLPSTPNTNPVNPNKAPSPAPQTQPNVLPLGDPQRTQISAEDASACLDTELMTIEVPSILNKHLNDLAIATMQFSFEMNMSDVRNAILYGEDVVQKTEPTLGEDAAVFYETIVEPDPQNQSELTVPLHFNVLINGAVHIDIDKLELEQLQDANLPGYQDAITSIAASMCGIGLQKNLATLNSEAHVETLEMMLDQNSSKAQIDLQNNQTEIHGKDGCKNPVLKPKRKCKKPPCKLDDPCEEDKCKPPKQKSDKPSAENTPQIMASTEMDNKQSAKKGVSYAKNDAFGRGRSAGKYNTYLAEPDFKSKYYHATYSFYKPKRYVCSSSVSGPKLPSFKIHLSLVRRRYSGKPSQKKLNIWGHDLRRNFCKRDKVDVENKCKPLLPKTKRRPRKDIKARTKLRTDCYKPSCKRLEEYAFKCSTLKYPRKKCARDTKVVPPPILPKQPEKEEAPICKVYKNPKNKK